MNPLTLDESKAAMTGAAKGYREMATQLLGGTPPDRLRKTPLTCTIKQPGAVHVVECGHKFDPREQPRQNCGFCWYVYFRIHPAEVPAGQSVIKVYGKEAIIRSKGLKYYKALQKAIEAYEWKQNQEALTRPMDLVTTQESQESTDLSESSPNLATVRSDGSSASCTTPATE